MWRLPLSVSTPIEFKCCCRWLCPCLHCQGDHQSKNPEEIKMHYRYVSVVALVGVAFYSCSLLVSSPPPPPSQHPICRVKVKDNLKPHDLEMQNRLWNLLTDWDKGGRQGLPKVEVNVGRNPPLVKVDRDLSESHVKAEVCRLFWPSQTSPPPPLILLLKTPTPSKAFGRMVIYFFPQPWATLHTADVTHQSPGMKCNNSDSKLEIVAEVSGNKLTFFLSFCVDLELTFRALYPPTPLSSPLPPNAGFLPVRDICSICLPLPN